MGDLVVQAVGSMNAAVQFAYDNGVSVSSSPVPGQVYVVSDAAIAAAGSVGAAVVKYFERRGVVIGNLGEPAQGFAGLLNEDERVLENEDGSNLLSD